MGGEGSNERTSTFNPCQDEAQDGGSGIRAFDTSVRTRDTVFVPGSPGMTVDCNFFASPGEDVKLLGGSTLVEYPGEALELSLDARWHSDNSIVTVAASGTPGDTVLLVVGPATGRVTLPGFTGDLHVGGPLGGARRVLLGAAPAQGALQLPDLAPFDILQWTVQSVQLRPRGEIVFGPTRALNVIDSAW
ncbi:MAG: hypothetical protein ACJAQ3_002106 [Planctomycetota bacterium]